MGTATCCSRSTKTPRNRARVWIWANSASPFMRWTIFQGCCSYKRRRGRSRAIGSDKSLGRVRRDNRERVADHRRGTAGTYLERVRARLIDREVAEAGNPVDRSHDGGAAQCGTRRIGCETDRDAACERGVGAAHGITRHDLDRRRDDLTDVGRIRLHEEPQHRRAVIPVAAIAAADADETGALAAEAA